MALQTDKPEAFITALLQLQKECGVADLKMRAYGIQREECMTLAVIPGSSNPDHIRENLDLFDFVLTEDEMEKINALDRNEKHD